MNDKNKVRCSECNWTGKLIDVDEVKDPGGDDLWSVCPNCRTPEHIVCACDEDGCWDIVTCGTPTKNGYRQTCSKHAP